MHLVTLSVYPSVTSHRQPKIDGHLLIRWEYMIPWGYDFYGHIDTELHPNIIIIFFTARTSRKRK